MNNETCLCADHSTRIWSSGQVADWGAVSWPAPG